MQKSRTNYSSYQPANTSQDILKLSYNIITNCNANVTMNGFNSKTMSMTKKQSKIPSYVFDPNQPNPQDQQLTNKYVEKLRLNSKKQNKQATIRKSQLGQNQMVFTNQEQMKLQIIDELLQKGYDLPQDPFNIQLFPSVDLNEIDMQTCLKQSGHQNPFREELADFQEWGEKGNKQNVLDIVDQPCKEHVQTTIKQLDKYKRKKKKELKLLNFAKKIKNIRNQIKPIKIIKQRTSIEIGQQKSYKIEKIPNIAPKLLSQFETQKHLKLIERKKFPSLDREIGLNKLNLSLFKRMQRKQKINQLTSYMNNKFCRIPRQGYMTTQRLQALYNCEMIKGAKEVMNKKDYINLRIQMTEPALIYQKQSSENLLNETIYIKKTEKEKQIDKANEEIEKILQKNLRRLKFQRQRVIQKLRC